MDVESHLFYGKFIWKIITGQIESLGDVQVCEALGRVFVELKDGILHFYTPSANIDGIANCIPEFLHELVYELHILLGLDVVHTWNIVTNYLKYELHGSARALITYLTNESRRVMLITDIWLFHWNDRLFRHKCMNFLLTYYQHESHKYQHIFRCLLMDGRQTEVVASQIKQLKKLFNSEVPVVNTHGKLMTFRLQTLWLSHILREQLEVLHNILICIENGFLLKDHRLVLLSVIQNDAFGSDIEEYGNILNENHKEVLEQIAYMEIIVIIRALQTLEKECFLKENLAPLKYFIDQMKTSCLRESSFISMCISAMMVAAAKREDAEEFVIKPQCFKFLEKMINHGMFKVPALYAKIAHNTVHDVIQVLANIAEIESFQQIEELYGIAITLLCHHEIIQRFFQSSSDDGLVILFSGAVKYFPKDSTLTLMVEKLSVCGPEYIDKLLELLTNLPTFLEVVTHERAVSLIDRDGYRILAPDNYRPLKYTKFFIPRGTVGTMPLNCPNEVIWKCKFNFFYILIEHILELQSKIRTCPQEIPDGKILEVVASFKIVANLIKSGCKLTEEIIICLDTLFPLLEMISQDILTTPTVLTAAILECAVALHLKFPSKVFARLERLRLVPTLNLDTEIKEETPASIFKSLPTSIAVTAIVSKESLRGEYPLLKAYVLLLQKILREPNVEVKHLNTSSGFVDETSLEKYASFILPGVVCMLRDIFPNIHTWWFKEEEERENMIVQCLHIVHWLLGIDADTSQNKPAASLLRSLCIYSLLYSPSGEMLLKVVATGEPQIQAIMEKELSWRTGRSATVIHLIHLALSILNRVILAKMNMQKPRHSCALEYELYSRERSKVQVPLVVANYIFNCFNPNLRSMAVVVLKRFAQDKPKTLLSFLSVDPSMIRFMFIGPLLSNLESENLKVNIVQLITLSLQSQPALANVFLNIQHLKEKTCYPELQDLKDVEFGCLPFIYTVLQGQGRNSPHVFEAVICFLHALWAGKCELVVEILRRKEGFWALFFAPVHDPKSYGWDVYKKIFNIVAYEEHHYYKKVVPQLHDQLRMFFADNINIDVWFKLFEELLVDTEFTRNKWEDTVSFFVTWKDFLLMYLACFDLNKSQKLVVYKYSMRILLNTMGDVERSGCAEQISELLAILMGNSHGDFICNYELALKELIQVLQKTSNFYNVITIHTKSSISMFSFELMQKLAELISQESTASISLMDSVCRIITKDLEHLPILIDYAIKSKKDENSVVKNKDTSKLKEWEKEVKVCSLNLIILQKLLLVLQKKTEFDSYMHRSKIFTILLINAGSVLQQPIFFDIAVSLMNNLFILAATPFSECMVSSRILEELALNLLPQNDKLSYTAVLSGAFELSKHWTCTRWTRVYIPALQMFTDLLCAQKFLFLEDAIKFMDCHIEYIVSAIMSFRYTLSAELPKAAIHLVYELSKEQYRTRTNFCQNMELLLRAVKNCLQSSIWLLIYPKHMHHMLRDVCLLSEREIFQVSPGLCYIQNDLLDLIVICHQVLLQYSPDLHDLSIDYPEEIMINKKLVVNLQPTYEDIKAPTQFLLKDDKKYLENTSITFNLLTSFINFCTAVISKVGRASSLPSRPRLGGSPIYSGNFASMWESTLNKCHVGTALEISLNLLLCQSILVLLKPDIKQIEKNCLRKFISNELVSLVRFANTCPNFPDIEPALKSSVERMSVRTISSEHLLEEKHSSSISTVEMLSAYSRKPSTVEMMSLVPSKETLLEKVSSTLMRGKAASNLTLFTEPMDISEESDFEDYFEDLNTFNLKKAVEEFPITVHLPPKPSEEFGYSSSSSSEEEEEEEVKVKEEQEEHKEEEKADDGDNTLKDEVEEKTIDVSDGESFREPLTINFSQSTISVLSVPSETVFGMGSENLTRFLRFMAFFFEHLFHIRQ